MSRRSIAKGEVQDAFFYGTDLVHYNRAAMGMEGCLLADLVLQGRSVEQSPSDDVLPEKLSTTSKMSTIWADTTLTGNFTPTELAGFTRQQGGNGGEKVWYGTSEYNASLTFWTKPATELSIMYYRHPDLPMGRAKVFVDGVLWTFLDGCCTKACPRVPEHQGFRDSSVVASNLDMKPHEVTIRTVQRSKKAPRGGCVQDGTKFDVLGVIGKVDTDAAA